MKTIILIFFSLCLNSSFSQSLNDTIGWIGQNTDGREQISYEENKVQFISVRQAGNLLSAFIKEIDPKTVKSIGIKEGNKGWNSIIINFKNGYGKVIGYTRNSSFEIVGDKRETNMAYISININCDVNKIYRLKKAYINFFKEIGINVTDGDLF